MLGAWTTAATVKTTGSRARGGTKLGTLEIGK